MTPPKKQGEKQPASPEMVAITDVNFYYQLKNGGTAGWNDQYLDPADQAAGKDRFYLKYYGIPVAQVELVELDNQPLTAIKVFGDVETIPCPDPAITPQQLKDYQKSVIEALHRLRLDFHDQNENTR